MKKFFISIFISIFLIFPASSAYWYDEENVLVLVNRLESRLLEKWTGEESKGFRDYLDYEYGNDDDTLSSDEIEAYIRDIEEEELRKGETDEIFLDGRRGEIKYVRCEAYQSFPGFLGDLAVDYPEPIDFVRECVLRAEWDLEEKEEHVYSRKGLPDGATVSFTVPEGWEIKSVEDLKGASISSDNRTVRGLAIVDKSHVIVFRRILPVVPFTPPPSITPTLVTPTPTPTLPPSPVTPAVTPVPPKEVDISTIHPSVSPGEIKQFQFTRSDIREIRAKLLTHSFHIGFRVEKIEFLQGIPEAGDFVYAYTNITPVRIVDGQLLPVDLKIEESWVDFRVGKEWIQKNGIDEERIKLARYEEKGRKWEYFHASILRKEREYIYYSAKIPGFSLLAITGDKILPAPPFDPKLGIALSAIFISVSILIFIFYRREKPVDLDLLRERARNIRALLESIDEQYSQRKISEKTYRELRRKNEKELAKVKRKMRRALR